MLLFAFVLELKNTAEIPAEAMRRPVGAKPRMKTRDKQNC